METNTCHQIRKGRTTTEVTILLSTGSKSVTLLQNNEGSHSTMKEDTHLAEAETETLRD